MLSLPVFISFHLPSPLPKAIKKGELLLPLPLKQFKSIIPLLFNGSVAEALALNTDISGSTPSSVRDLESPTFSPHEAAISTKLSRHSLGQESACRTLSTSPSGVALYSLL